MKIANKDARSYVERKREFTGSNLFAEVQNGKTGWRYVVYSYGEHYPMFVYLSSSDCWFENSDKSSRSTERQRSQCRPNAPTHPLSTGMMKHLIGGYVE